MNGKHLLWIIPLVAIVVSIVTIPTSYQIGRWMGLMGSDEFVDGMNQLNTDVLELCVDMINYTSNYDGSCEEAYLSYKDTRPQQVAKFNNSLDNFLDAGVN